MENIKYLEILSQNKILGASVKGPFYNVSILANVTINPIVELIEYISRLNQINSLVKVGNYDNIIQDSILHKESDLVIIFYDLFKIIEGLPSFFEMINDNELEKLKQSIINEIDVILENLKDTPSVILNTFSSSYFVSDYHLDSKIELFIRDMNNYLLDLPKEGRSNLNLVNIDKIIGKIGAQNAFDFRLYFSSKVLYTIPFLKNYAKAVEPILLKNNGKLKKALIFDCDNTLWGGILGEDGLDGIEMSLKTPKGKIFNKIQQIAAFLSEKGVIIGLCSKNNEDDVLEVMNNHKDYVLKDKYVVIKKINWEDKSSNLRSIASDLNIGLDSLVFVDDSDFEINLIKETIPEIHTIRVPSNIFEYPDLLLKNVYTYFNLVISDEDKMKTQIYKQQFKRSRYKKEGQSIDEYLSTLGIEITTFQDDLSLVPRISQMTQKTNQFNLTTKRYTENQIENFIKSPNHTVFSISVKDNFGENGVTGLCILDLERSTKKATINSFLMSCRIIGRNIEFVLFDFVINRIVEMGYSKILASYIPTKKNEQVKELYENIGFEVVKIENGVKEYSLEIANYTKKEINYIKIL